MQKQQVIQFITRKILYLMVGLFGMLIIVSDTFAQNYEFSLVQRRKYDQIAVEIWAKSLVNNAPKIGGATLVLQYNSQYLTPASEQVRYRTDSINANINQLSPVDEIVSPFSSPINGFDALESQSYSSGYYSLEVKQRSLGMGGLVPSKAGKGTFVGKLIFNIIGNPSDNSLTKIDFSRSVMPGDLRIFDYQGNDIESTCTFNVQPNFPVIGITLLSPSQSGQVVDRDFDYVSLIGDYAGGGYPIYFERSINPASYGSPIDEDLAYHLEYSIDNGEVWNNIGRVAESGTGSSATGGNSKMRSGEIFSANKSTAYLITSQNGSKLDVTTYRDPVRVIWTKNPYFTERSENARLRITRLAGYNNIDIISRSHDNSFGISKATFVLGRLFFLQLNGNSEYVKTPNNVSNSTQLTVEAWINVNELKPVGSETGLVVSSAGPEATQILGSREGAWMLFLKDGRIPAFRVREIQGRGTNGYIGTVKANYLDSVIAVSSIEPLSRLHAKNWVHIAATVNNNALALYINGELVDKLVNTQATDIRMLTTSHPVWIGLNPNDSIEQSDYLNGGIKGVKLWKIALSQDEIRQRAAGVSEPAVVTAYGDLRRGLQLYYSFEGTFNDLATDALYQFGAENANFHSSGVISNASAFFRPDQPHIKLTAPTEGVGISNKDGATTEIRWISYGLGNIGKSGTKDVDIEYSIDNGVSWYYARDIAGKTLGGTLGVVDVENSTTVWSLRNDAPSPSIKTINPFSRPAILKIRGTEANAQTDLYDLSGTFSMAPNFSIFKSEASMIALAENSGMNIIGNTAFIEAWVRPYRFPTAAEGAFPLITKIDSITQKFHYDLSLLPDGKLRFRVMDTKDSIRVATSSLALVRPNSISMDTAWSHIGVYLFLNNGTGSSEVRFYVDGFADRDTSATTGLGTALAVNSSNAYPVFIGYKPSISTKSTGNITVYGSQTRNLNLVGNIYNGIAVDTTLNISTSIFDQNGSSHNLNLKMKKTATAKIFNYDLQIDSKTIPWITPKVSVSGNLDASANNGNSVAVIANVYDSTTTPYQFNLNFTKTSTSGLYNFQISYGTKILYNGQVEFNPNGTVKSPMQIELTPFELNTAIAKAVPNDVVFDTTKPQNLVFELSNYDNPALGLTNYSIASSTIATKDYKREIIFNEDGSLKSPETISLDSYYLNKALGTKAFDALTPKDIILHLRNTVNNSVLSYSNATTSLAINGQDGIGTKTISGEVIITSDTSRGYIGELREIRFWNGTPNNTSAIAAQEPTPMTLFIQGAQAIRGNDLTVANSANLHSMYSFNGGNKVMQGWYRASGMNINTNAVARFFGQAIKYLPTEPYIKLVEPAFKQNVANMATDLRVRWVGFNYDGDGFVTGTPTKTPSLEFSIRGGGGQLVQPYQFVGCDYWKGNVKDAITIPNNTKFKFSGTGTDIIYALNLDASIADPDENDDGGMKQGPLSASLTNARFRLTGLYSMFTQSNVLQSEGPLFSITPSSNFTIRTVLEGHHDGANSGKLMNNIGTTFANGGVRIKLYRDIGTIGDSVATQESSLGYDILDPANKNAGNFRFANINYIFTDLNDGNYYVLVEHINHLPIMSRFPSTFKFTGDDRSTWRIESGWDFTSWNGVDDNVLINPLNDPTPTGAFTAYGYAKRTTTDVNYSVTGLVYNDGRSGGNTKQLAAMIGGDVNQDWQINAADRVKVRLDDGTGLVQSDVTGDGYVNADDRTITDRNFGHVASIYKVTFPVTAKIQTKVAKIDPMNDICEKDINLSKFFISNAKKTDNLKYVLKNKSDELQAGLNYDVMAEANLKDNTVELRFYIKNKGGEFGLANCTFPVKYNSSVLEFAGLSGKDSVMFSNDSIVGYANLRTAPTADAVNPLPEVRTIEIDYDAFANLGGKAVPFEKTYIGSLLFNLKTKNGAVTFNWHDSKSVHTTDRRVATGNGNFITINPILLYSAALISPNGGEKLSQGRSQSVKWNTNGDALVFVEFSADNGITWERVNSAAVNINTKAIAWTTPEYSSSNCLMRIIDSETGYEIDRSDSVFSVTQAFAQIIRPASGDPVYIGGKSDFIRWSAQGLDKVRFEFSPDAGTTWTTVSPNINSTDISSGWQLPKVTTKTAVVRMVDIENNKEITRSAFFKILTGNLTFKSPVSKEKLLAKKDTRIRWTSSDLDEFDMQLSMNGGYSWTLIRSNVVGYVSYHNWSIPDTSSENCIIRAIWNGDPEMEFARTGIFTIISPNSVVDNLPAGIEFSNISPNPANGSIRINIKNDCDITANVEILTYSGEFVKSLGQFTVSSGVNHFNTDISDLLNGKYLLIFKSEKFTLTRELVISR